MKPWHVRGVWMRCWINYLSCTVKARLPACKGMSPFPSEFILITCQLYDLPSTQFTVCVTDKLKPIELCHPDFHKTLPKWGLFLYQFLESGSYSDTCQDSGYFHAMWLSLAVLKLSVTFHLHRYPECILWSEIFKVQRGVNKIKSC